MALLSSSASIPSHVQRKLVVDLVLWLSLEWYEYLWPQVREVWTSCKLTQQNRSFRTRQHHTTQESGGVWFFIAATPKHQIVVSHHKVILYRIVSKLSGDDYIVPASAPLHTQDTEIGLGALVWQPQPSFSISDRSCLVAKKSRTDCEQNSRTEDEGRMRAAWRKREREQKRRQRVTKRGQTRKTIRCYQSEK